MSRQTHTEHVYQLVCQYPGHPVAWLAWIEAGGRIENGRPVGATKEHGFAQHHRVLGVQKRVYDLIEQGMVVWGELVVQTRTSGRGVWPVNRSDVIERTEDNSTPPVARRSRAKDQLHRMRGLTGG